MAVLGRTMFATAAGPAAAPPPQLDLDPAMPPRDRLVYLLHAAAEVEHSLLVEYLYAAWSLRADGSDRVRRWKRHLLEVAREEMAHFAAVQNLLRFVGGPLNLDREDFPFRSDLYPFPFQLEPLGLSSLARYVAAEMPAESGVDPVLVADVRKQLEIGDERVNRVGVLYDRLRRLVADPALLPDEDLRGDGADTTQVRPERFRADVGHGPLYLRTVSTRAEALALIDDVAAQGEGDRDEPDSHFLTFVEIFQAWRDDPPLPSDVHDVPVNPNASRAPAIGDPDPLAAGRITERASRAWAIAFDHQYRMLLTWLQHALLAGSSAPRARGLALRVFDAMFAVAEIGELLATLSRTGSGDAMAGATFGLPYTMALPDLEADRWTLHAELLAVARRHMNTIPPPAGQNDLTVEQKRVRTRVLSGLDGTGAFLAEWGNVR